MAYRVFLSHASADQELAQLLRAEIVRFDIQVYMYEHDLQPGRNLSAKLLTEIGTSDAVVVLLTAQGSASPAVNQELGVALQA